MASVQGVYIAIFGRPADPGGLAYWNGVTNNGADLSQMIAAFTDADEFRERYEGQTSAEIVTSIYQALFGREPDAEGLAFYSEALENGELPIESIAVSVLDGAQNEDQQRVQNKEAAADKFTASLDTPEEIAAYSGENAENYGEAFLNKVTDDPETVPTDEEVEQATDEVEALPPEGQAPQEPEEPEEPGNPGGGGTPTTFSLVDNDGTLEFAGNADGVISITAVDIDGDTATITATREGRTDSIVIENFEGIAAGVGEDLAVSADLLDGLSVGLTGGAALTVNASYEDLSSENDELPAYDISNVSVDGSNDPDDVWDSVSVTSGNIADKFKLFWATGDAKYYDAGTGGDLDSNTANVLLGNVYADYLVNGGDAIVDVVQTKVGGDPNFDQRQQSLHDNLLGNLGDDVIESRFDEDPRTENAIAFGARPFEEGSPSVEFSDADQWDALNGVSRPDLEQSVLSLAEGPGTMEDDWVSDRSGLEGISDATDPENEDNTVISFDIREEGKQGDGTGDGSGGAFHRYQGVKLAEDDHVDVAHGGSISYDFYIDPAWADGQAHLSGVWVQMMDASGENEAWSIVEYLDADASAERRAHQAPSDGETPPESFEGFRFWNSEVGYNEYFAFDGNGWVNLTFEFSEDAHAWYLDGNEVYRDVSPLVDSVEIMKNVIFNSQNFGEDQAYLYDDIEINGISLNEDYYVV